jgi:hypothetical protein
MHGGVPSLALQEMLWNGAKASWTPDSSQLERLTLMFSDVCASTRCKWSVFSRHCGNRKACIYRFMHPCSGNICFRLREHRGNVSRDHVVRAPNVLQATGADGCGCVSGFVIVLHFVELTNSAEARADSRRECSEEDWKQAGDFAVLFLG